MCLLQMMIIVGPPNLLLSRTLIHTGCLSLSLCSLAKPLFPGDLSTPKYVAHIMNNKSVKSFLLDER